MSEEGNGYPKVQLSTFIHGDQFVFRGENGEQLQETVKSVAKTGEETVKALTAFKHVAVANGVFTGDSKNKGVAKEESVPRERAADSPPPGDDTPRCGCGVPMKDLAHKNYKKRWYAGDDCKTKGKGKDCWAKA